ncbi:Pkinase domain-containing protein [Cephalotus follicularis]|uniref:non-specific serine/threonine protein kinase n=2 Tax=Cephalotus follicularis TaxID=3775 RepID=A0A1Q3D845_CEPFO|nr:Pkinase domain-containing protein [Cephalotus follicularis]
MNLNQTGNLGLLGDENATIWQSPVNKSAILVPTPSIARIAPVSAPSTLPGGESQPNSPPPPGPNGIDLATIASIIGGIISFASFCLLFAHIILRLRKRKKEEGEEFINQQVPGMPVRFSYEDLCTATEGFKEKLGGGGFGSVFKGVLQDGTRIAVKRLDNLGQGMREFVAEVETIGSLHHFNLVRLMGFCAERSHRLLVYEFMSNGSLDKWIFNKDQRPRLDWQTRKKIVLDIAKGLAYLHEDCRQKIMHLDIKPQNILLDENFHAKVSDFGLSTLINRDESQVLTTMRGTPGYLAPEWRQLRITVKVDIYSFGIVVLEIVSARRNLDRSRSEFSFHLLEVLRGKAEEERLIDIVEYLDRDMLDNTEEVERMIKIAIWCLQEDPAKRPLMSTVVKVLEGVMEVDPNINYKFSRPMPSPAVINDYFSSAPPQASVLSNPR